MDEAIAAVIGRVERSLSDGSEAGFPHYADAETGVWVRSVDGDWNGGFWVGLLWLSDVAASDNGFGEGAERFVKKLRSRVRSATTFRGLLFWYGAAIGWLLTGNETGRSVALEGARGLATLYNPEAGLIPRGHQASIDHPAQGRDDSNIDGVPGGTALLFWSAGELNRPELASIARSHAGRHLETLVRADGSVCQSMLFDPADGSIRRLFTHKGYAAETTWARAQGWAIIGAAQAAAHDPWFLPWLETVCDWWVGHVPVDGVAPWDFGDRSIPHVPVDTSASAMAAAGLLKAAILVPGSADTYRQLAVTTISTLIDRYLIVDPTIPPQGRLRGGCYNPHSRLPTDLELIWGDYYLLEALLAATDRLDPTLI